MKPVRLLCEFSVDPLGIDVREPRLAWSYESAARNQRQSAYRIVVASTPDKASAGEGDLWDSGKILESGITMARYQGTPLGSHQRCYWRVKAWDAAGSSTDWSPVAAWSMGILEQQEWKGEWIGHDAPRAAAKPDTSWKLPENRSLLLPPPRYLRRVFEVQRPVRRAVLYATALGICELYLDGGRVSDDRFTPGWTDYTKRVYYRAYDLTSRLSGKGAHAIGAVLADGWYSGYIGYAGTRDHYGPSPRLLLTLRLEYADGSVSEIVTGPDWQATTGPLLEADFLMGEVYDARRDGAGHLFLPEGTGDWVPVDVGAPLHPRVQAHPAPPVRSVAEFRPKSVQPAGPGKWVFDMGQNFAGAVRLRVSGSAGKRITLRYAERLNPDGSIYITNLRAARSRDIYLCRGSGSEEWEPRFTFHGFQYVEVSGVASATPSMLTGIAVSSDLPAAGTFECSDPMINQLHSNILWTQRANFIDVPTDCPQRDERLGWTGDAQVYIRSACLLADARTFYQKWLVDLADAQRADGQFPMVAPLKVAGDDGGPAWADAGVICPWTAYEMYGDPEILQRHYPAMVRFVEFCMRRSTPELLPPEKFHCFGDWLNIHAETPAPVLYTAYFAHAADLLSRTADVLGLSADAQKYRALFDLVRGSFRKAFVSPDGRIEGNTQTAYVLALAFDLLDDATRPLAAQRLVGDIELRGWHLSTGFVGTKELMPVLSAIGRTDVAYRLLQNETFPSWGFTIRNGATSIWERWDGWTPEKGFQDPGMNSFAHYSFGAVYQWMVETIGGIKALAPGYRRLQIAPQPGGTLAWARVGYRSASGPISVTWQLTEGKMSLRVSIPPGTSATIRLPGVDGAVLESGIPVERRPELIPAGEGSYEAGSGDYHFSYSYHGS